MKKLNPSSKYSIPFGFALLYLFLPTENSGIDGYAYASAVKWGDELIWPHHLLYSPFGRGIYLVANYLGLNPDALGLMKMVNALAAGLCLFVLYKILETLDIFKPGYFVIFCGSCFGFMRYATENETYILPILCSLSATFFFAKFLKNQKHRDLVLSGFLFGLGALFHQIHILWYAGFGLALVLQLKSFRFKTLVLFISGGALPIITVYLWFYNLSQSNTQFTQGILSFILHDVYSGQVNTSLGIQNVIMTPISFIRTFIQVHGYMKNLLLSYPVLFLVPITFVTVAFVAMRSFIKHSRTQGSPFPVLSKAIFWAFIFQFAFAFYSVGNAEFMVMFPILMLLWLVLKFAIPVKPVLYLGMGLLFYNLALGLAPAHFLDLDGSKPLLKKMEAYPKSVWILKEPQKMENRWTYKYHWMDTSKIIIEKSFKNASNLRPGFAVMTDAIHSDESLNRGNFLSKTDLKKELKGYKYIAKDSVIYFGGKKVLYEIIPK